MKRAALFSIVILFISTIISGCSHNDIKLDTVHQTSDHLECDKIFAGSRKAIIELNEILIQTGTIDGHDLPACVIHVNGKEVTMRLVNAIHRQNETEELYENKDHQLQLIYHPEAVGNTTVYIGHCKITKGKLQTELNIEGSRNML